MTGIARWRRCLPALIVGTAVGLTACSGTDTSGSTTTVATAPPATVPTECDQVTGLFPAEPVLEAGSSPCATWIDTAAGRTVKGSTGSASVWTRRTGHGTALVVGAVHTLGQGWFGPEGTAIEEKIVDPADQVGVPRLFLWREDGSGLDSLASPWFGLYNPAVAAERNGNLMRDVWPQEDFYVAVTDSQKLDVGGPSPMPNPIILELVPLYDPAGATIESPTFTEAEAGSLVLLLGYPDETGRLAAGVGRVLSDGEAVAAVAALADAGDPEGSIPYDAEVEVIIEGPATAGMSGGPVISRAGRLVGV